MATDLSQNGYGDTYIYICINNYTHIYTTYINDENTFIYYFNFKLNF